MQYVIDHIADIAYRDSIKHSDVVSAVPAYVDSYINDNRDIEHVFDLAKQFDSKYANDNSWPDSPEVSEMHEQAREIRDKYKAINDAVLKSRANIYDEVGAMYGKELESSDGTSTMIKKLSTKKSVYFLTVEKRVIPSAEYNRTVNSFTKSITDIKSALTSKLEEVKKMIKAEESYIDSCVADTYKFSATNPFTSYIRTIVSSKTYSLQGVISTTLSISTGLYQEINSALKLMQNVVNCTPHARSATHTVINIDDDE